MQNAARRKQAEKEALVWLEKIERVLQGDENIKLAEWLKVRLHREAILQRSAVWHDPEIVHLIRQLVPAEERFPKEPSLRPRKAARVFIGAVGIACIALAFGIFTLWLLTPYRGHHGNTRRSTEVYSTPVGASRSVTLPDSSTLKLNTNSRVIVLYGPHFRDATLLQGEASFVVLGDSKRPFRLAVASRVLEAAVKGARFNVRSLSPSSAEVVVTGGELKILYAGSGDIDTPAQLRLGAQHGEITLGPLEGATIGKDWQIPWTWDRQRVQSRLAWQRGMLVFEDVPLMDVVAEVRRYTTTDFAFESDSLGTRRLSAELHIGDVSGFLRTLRQQLQIDGRADARGKIILAPIVSQRDKGVGD